MFVNLSTKRFLNHTHTIILGLETHPQGRIDAFAQAFINAARHNGTPAYIAMADATEQALSPFHEARTTTNVDKKTKTTEVKIIIDNKEFVKKGLKDLETKINTITDNNQLEIEKLNLNKKSIFYLGAEADRVLNFEQLLKAIKLNPLFADIFTQATDFTKQCIKLYTDKTETSTTILFDVSDKKTLIDPIKDVMYLNFLTTSGLNIGNLSKMRDYFTTNLMDLDNNISDFLYKNEYRLLILAGTFINDPRIVFKFGDSLKIESKGLGGAKVFLSDTANPTTIPGRAVNILEGGAIEFPIQNIGSATELYLIFVATSATLDAELKVTVIPKK